MSDQTLAVPLDRLRVMPPVGAPGVAVVDACDEDGEGYTIKAGGPCVLLGEDRNMVAAMATGAGAWHPRPYARHHLALDLSAPTTPRIDGSTVAATMLADAAGLDVSQGVTWKSWRKLSGLLCVIVRTENAEHYYTDYNVKTDATDPREILAAVLVAVLGVKP